MSGGITEEAREVARKLANRERADVYVYNGPINEDGVGAAVEAYAAEEAKDSAILLLTTNGGSAIARAQAHSSPPEVTACS